MDIEPLGEIIPFPANPGTYWRRRASESYTHEETLVVLYLVILDLEEKYGHGGVLAKSDADQMAFPWASGL